MASHRCDLAGSLDYSRTDPALGLDQSITCTVCSRIWKLHQELNNTTGVTYTSWWPYPCPECNINPKACKHYGRRNFKKKTVKR
jgi:hypothetical protein